MTSARRYSFSLACIVLVMGCRGERGSFADDSPFDYNARMFVADEDSSGTYVCFATRDTTLLPGTRVTIVFTGFPQHSAVGRITTRGKLPCIPGPPMPPMDSIQYVAEMPRDTADRIGIPVVLLGRVREPVQRGDTVTIAMEPGQPPIRFRVCASTEGLHATAWAGAPLASPRLWHSYYYLGYDVDPTCDEKEYTPRDSALAPSPP
ncbi:MAG TPA: hypothetical protein VGO75_10865 [Gemmatimonadaceae bacterium]|nr:hypothetical protein [Gemmatimonadaceae bacterium]